MASSFAFQRLALPDQLEWLEDLLSISRNRQKNGLVLRKLQLVLLFEIIEDENSVKGLKKLAEEKGLALHDTEALAQDEATKKLSAAVQNGLQFHRTRANSIRQIGDGIAWRSFGYDRAVMRLLSQRPTKQQVSLEGTALELQEWFRNSIKDQRIGVINAVTNTLGIGDITVANSDGSGEVIEVKASKVKSRRITRQKQQMREVVQLLNTGHGEIEEKENDDSPIRYFPEKGLEALLELLDWRAIRVGAQGE